MNNIVFQSKLNTINNNVIDVKDMMLNKMWEFSWGSAAPFWSDDLAGGGSATYCASGWLQLECDGALDRAGNYYNPGATACGLYNLAAHNKTYFQFGISFDAAAATWDNTEVFAGLCPVNAAANRTTQNIAGIIMNSDVPYFLTDKAGTEELTDISSYFANTITNSWSGTVIIVYDNTIPAYLCYINNVLAATHSTQVPTTANVEGLAFKNKSDAGGTAQRMNVGPILIWWSD